MAKKDEEGMNQRVETLTRHMKERVRQLTWRSHRYEDADLAMMADRYTKILATIDGLRGKESLTEKDEALISLGELLAQFDDLQADYQVMPEYKKALLDPETRHSLETGEPPSRLYIVKSLTWGRLRNWLLGI